MSIRPCVFVSSTCYDLSEVRSGLRTSIETDLGYQTLLSEHPVFPIDHDGDTVANCLNRVRNNAHLFVLIIGERYGWIPPGDEHSVVNQEYFAAREAGIPVYAFVFRSVIDEYEAWAASDSKDEDNPKRRLFKFVERVRDEDSTWVLTIENADEIADRLREQFAYKMHEGLALLAKVNTRQDLALLERLSGRAMQLAIAQPDGWTGHVFAECLMAHVNRLALERADFEDGIAIGPGEYVAPETAFEWIASQLAVAGRTVDALNFCMKHRATPALNSNSIADIARAADALGRAYREMLGWSHRLRTACVPEHLERLAYELSKSLTDGINKVATAGPILATRIQEAIDRSSDGAEVHVSLKIQIEMSNQSAIQAEIERLRAEYGDRL